MDDKLVRLSDVIETVENQCSDGKRNHRLDGEKAFSAKRAGRRWTGAERRNTMENDLIRRGDALAVASFWGVDRCKRAKLYNIPAVDAVEVRHAEWVASSTEHTFSDGTKARWNIWKCSRCPYVRTAGWEYTAEGQKPKARYCESCGARMDGRREDGLYESLKRVA